jgi:hypothetical protein
MLQVITANRSLVLCADSRTDMEEWMAALRAAAAGEPEIVTVRSKLGCAYASYRMPLLVDNWPHARTKDAPPSAAIRIFHRQSANLKSFLVKWIFKAAGDLIM